MDRLFELFDRTYLEPAKHNDNTYNYYNISANVDNIKVRNTLDGWFCNYPDNEKKELKNRFKKDFNSAFYELFLYELFSKLGYNIIIHPDLTSSPKKPDFLISKDDLEIYVEAKVVTNKTKEQEATDRKINEFYDNLNKLELDDYFLQIKDFKVLTQKQPSTKGIISYIKQELKKLDPVLLRNEVDEGGFDKLPIIKYNNGDIYIIVKPIPVKPFTSKEKKQLIGIYPVKTFCGGGVESLKDSIEKKARRYGKFDKPFIVCLNTLDVVPSGKEDVDDAIWGSLSITWSTNPDNKDETLMRQLDGVFLEKSGARLKNLTGVFVSKICPHNIPVANYWLYEHPFSENKMDFNKIGLKFNYVDKGYFIDNTGDDLDEILGISKDWLI